jgi:ankyrin repeat protein
MDSENEKQKFNDFKKIIMNGDDIETGEDIKNAEDAAISLVTDEIASYIDIQNDRNTGLILACMRRMSNLALKLIKNTNTNPGHVNTIGYTALHYACKNKMSRVALKLIKTGRSNPIHINSNGYTALHYACKNKMSVAALKLIGIYGLENNTRISLRDPNGYTALAMACATKNEDIALELIETPNSRPDLKTRLNETALIIACKNNMPEVALALIETEQSKPETVDIRGNTALIWACRNRMENVAFALIATNNAKPELVTDPQDVQFLKPILDKYSMTAFIYTSNLYNTKNQNNNRANTELNAENIYDISKMLDFLPPPPPQNAGFRLKNKGFLRNNTNKRYINKRYINNTNKNKK